MISIDQLPRDANGIVQGAWRLVHEDPTFAGGLGPIHMQDGVSTVPVCGRTLRAVVAEYGGRLFIEPWGPLPQSFALPELVGATVPDEQLARLPRAPWRDAAAEACMPLTLELLRLGGDGAPTDFARTLADVANMTGNDAIAARALFIERAATLRQDGYVEIPAALDGAVDQLNAIIQNEPPTAPTVEADPVRASDVLPAVLAVDDGQKPSERKVGRRGQPRDRR